MLKVCAPPEVVSDKAVVTAVFVQPGDVIAANQVLMLLESDQARWQLSATEDVEIDGVCAKGTHVLEGLALVTMNLARANAAVQYMADRLDIALPALVKQAQTENTFVSKRDPFAFIADANGKTYNFTCSHFEGAILKKVLPEGTVIHGTEQIAFIEELSTSSFALGQSLKYPLTVTSIDHKVGDKAEQGTPYAMLKDSEGQSLRLPVPIAGYVAEILIEEGQVIDQPQPYVRMAKLPLELKSEQLIWKREDKPTSGGSNTTVDSGKSSSGAADQKSEKTENGKQTQSKSSRLSAEQKAAAAERRAEKASQRGQARAAKPQKAARIPIPFTTRLLSSIVYPVAVMFLIARSSLAVLPSGGRPDWYDFETYAWTIAGLAVVGALVARFLGRYPGLPSLSTPWRAAVLVMLFSVTQVLGFSVSEYLLLVGVGLVMFMWLSINWVVRNNIAWVATAIVLQVIVYSGAKGWLPSQPLVRSSQDSILAPITQPLLAYLRGSLDDIVEGQAGSDLASRSDDQDESSTGPRPKQIGSVQYLPGDLDIQTHTVDRIYIAIEDWLKNAMLKDVRVVGDRFYALMTSPPSFDQTYVISERTDALNLLGIQQAKRWDSSVAGYINSFVATDASDVPSVLWYLTNDQGSAISYGAASINQSSSKGIIRQGIAAVVLDSALASDGRSFVVQDKKGTPKELAVLFGNATDDFRSFNMEWFEDERQNPDTAIALRTLDNGRGAEVAFVKHIGDTSPWIRIMHLARDQDNGFVTSTPVFIELPKDSDVTDINVLRIQALRNGYIILAEKTFDTPRYTPDMEPRYQATYALAIDTQGNVRWQTDFIGMQLPDVAGASVLFSSRMQVKGDYVITGLQPVDPDSLFDQDPGLCVMTLNEPCSTLHRFEAPDQPFSWASVYTYEDGLMLWGARSAREKALGPTLYEQYMNLYEYQTVYYPGFIRLRWDELMTPYLKAKRN